MLRDPGYTARNRVLPSVPVRYLVANDLLHGSILDYGCGKGTDVAYLRRSGYVDVAGYDPYQTEWTRFPEGRYNTILNLFVMNTIQVEERKQLVEVLLIKCASLGTIYIAARPPLDVCSEARRRDWKQVGNGFTTKIGTYQEGISARHLLDLFHSFPCVAKEIPGQRFTFVRVDCTT